MSPLKLTPYSTKTEAFGVSQPRFAIGQKYRSSSKRETICTVTDVHKTYNSAGDLVKIRYVSTHEFCGQTVQDLDVCETTIARGAI